MRANFLKENYWDFSLYQMKKKREKKHTVESGDWWVTVSERTTECELVVGEIYNVCAVTW